MTDEEKEGAQMAKIERLREHWFNLDLWRLNSEQLEFLTTTLKLLSMVGFPCPEEQK